VIALRFFSFDSHPQIGSDYLLDVGEVRRITEDMILQLQSLWGGCFAGFFHRPLGMFPFTRVEYTLRLWCYTLSIPCDYGVRFIWYR
jgi:hypothetical protein